MLIPIALCSFTAISFSSSETVCVSLGVDASFIDLFNIPDTLLFFECSTGNDADGLVKTDGFSSDAETGKAVEACAVFCTKYDDLESDFKETACDFIEFSIISLILVIVASRNSIFVDIFPTCSLGSLSRIESSIN